MPLTPKGEFCFMLKILLPTSQLLLSFCVACTERSRSIAHLYIRIAIQHSAQLPLGQG